MITLIIVIAAVIFLAQYYGYADVSFGLIGALTQFGQGLLNLVITFFTQISHILFSVLPH